MHLPGTHVSSLRSETLAGLFVVVHVEDIRENTKKDAEYEGQFGVIPNDQEFIFFPVEVLLESGERRRFWRHSLRVAEGYICAGCETYYRGSDYLCPECRRATETDSL